MDSANNNDHLSISGSETGNVSTALSVYKFATDDEMKAIKLWKGE